MGFNIKSKKRRKNTDYDFATEIYEIISEKLDDLKVKIPEYAQCDIEYEIYDFISGNKKRLIRKKCIKL